MPVSVRKNAFLAIAIAGSLMLPSLHCFANEDMFDKDRIGLADAVALTDNELGEMRGTGFVLALTQSLLDPLMSTVRSALAFKGALGGALGSGSFAGSIPAFLALLPPGNTVSAEINNQPTVTFNGTGPQLLSCSSGLTCGAGTSMLVSASNPAASHLNIAVTLH